MEAMMAQFLVLAVFPALLLLAAAWDLASFTIPNAISLALVSTFLVLAFLVGMPAAMLGWHALAGAGGLLLGFLLFALGFIGGGDAKLFASVALLLGLHDALPYALIASLLGGGLTLGLLAMRRWPLPQFLAKPWLLRLHDEREGVPYGVALAAGAFVLLPHTEIFRLAAGG